VQNHGRPNPLYSRGNANACPFKWLDGDHEQIWRKCKCHVLCPCPPGLGCSPLSSRFCSRFPGGALGRSCVSLKWAVLAPALGTYIYISLSSCFQPTPVDLPGHPACLVYTPNTGSRACPLRWRRHASLKQADAILLMHRMLLSVEAVFACADSI
jgi:hypothetical protein